MGSACTCIHAEGNRMLELILMKRALRSRVIWAAARGLKPPVRREKRFGESMC